MLSLATRQIKALRVPSVRQESLWWGHAAAHSEQAVQCSGGHGQKLVPCTSWLCPPAPPGLHHSQQHLLAFEDGACSLQRGFSAMDQFPGESASGICET